MEKLKPKHYSLFKKEVSYWVKRLGLTDWEIYYGFDDKDKDSFATVNWRYKARKATIFLHKNWDVPNVNIDIERQIKTSALHEVLHILLARLNGLANDRTLDEIEYDSEEHGVINTIINLLEQKE